jgi:transcription initiation factor IIE alpha subunit
VLDVGLWRVGIWTKDLKSRTNLQQTHITKILRTLDQRKLIKSVKSVASANRKVYMAFEVEPAREITGGAWSVGSPPPAPLFLHASIVSSTNPKP